MSPRLGSESTEGVRTQARKRLEEVTWKGLLVLGCPTSHTAPLEDLKAEHDPKPHRASPE